MSNGKYPDDPLMEIMFSIRGLAKEIENDSKQRSAEFDKLYAFLQQNDKALDRLPAQIAEKLQAIVERHVILSSAESMSDFKKMIDDTRHMLYMRQLSGASIIPRTSGRELEREEGAVIRHEEREERRSERDDTARIELKKTGAVSVVMDANGLKKIGSVIKWIVVTTFATGGIAAMIRSIIQAIKGQL